jgi:hypothetical protein
MNKYDKEIKYWNRALFGLRVAIAGAVISLIAQIFTLLRMGGVL